MEGWRLHLMKEAMPASILDVYERLENVVFTEVNIEQYYYLAHEIYDWVEDSLKKIELVMNLRSTSCSSLTESLEGLTHIGKKVSYFHRRLELLEGTLPAADKSLLFASYQSYMSTIPLPGKVCSEKQMWEFYDLAKRNPEIPLAIESLWDIYTTMKVIPFAPSDTQYIAEALYQIVEYAQKYNEKNGVSVWELEHRNPIFTFPEEAVDLAYDTLDWYDERYTTDEESDSEKYFY